jgi:hypothetical protein
MRSAIESFGQVQPIQPTNDITSSRYARCVFRFPPLHPSRKDTGYGRKEVLDRRTDCRSLRTGEDRWGSSCQERGASLFLLLGLRLTIGGCDHHSRIDSRRHKL